MPKITKRTVDAARPQKGDLCVWDNEIKGFGLRVFPTGTKTYVYQYRTKEGRSRRVTIGKHGAITPDQARDKALDMQHAVNNGGDPQAEKQEAREALTVADVLDRYLASAKFQEKTPATQANDRGRIERHLKPTMGKKFVNDLTAEHVRRAFSKIRDGKTAVDVKTGPRGRAIVRGGEGAARMAIRVFRVAMNWAIGAGWATKNPAHDVEIGNDGVREVVLENADDYARLFKTLDRMENEKRIRQAQADAVRVIALTGARRGEITGLRWRHVFLNKGEIVLPPQEHKTGHKTNKPRIIGLPPTAQAIIARQPDGETNDLVFPPTKGSGTITLANVWRRVRKEAKLPDGIGLHGLRHSLASSMAASGAQAAEIMTVLGHRQLSTAQNYIHPKTGAHAALAERAAAHISNAMNPKKAAEITPIRTGKKGRG